MTPAVLPLALSMGEAAGIGPEITLKAWHARNKRDVHPFVYVGSPDLLHSTAQALQLDTPLRPLKDIGEAGECWNDALPVLAVELSEIPQPMKPSMRNASATVRAIDLCVELVQAGSAGGIVTNPIHKATLYGAGFTHPGHTEYLATLAGDNCQVVMMLAVDTFRTVPVTVHMPLSAAIQTLSTELIYTTGRIVADGLRHRLNIAAPRLAVAGLNPHAGESGTLGAEETEIIMPAIERLRDDGIHVTGPLPADTMFHEAARQSYDAALCMYHDQALIPIKTIGFDTGVNCTLGLPFVRTSPDHGTALNIAGKGIARPDSLIAALNMAGIMAGNAKIEA